jgi:hypothetical protein
MASGGVHVQVCAWLEGWKRAPVGGDELERIDVVSDARATRDADP